MAAARAYWTRSHESEERRNAAHSKETDSKKGSSSPRNHRQGLHRRPTSEMRIMEDNGRTMALHARCRSSIHSTESSKQQEPANGGSSRNQGLENNNQPKPILPPSTLNSQG